MATQPSPGGNKPHFKNKNYQKGPRKNERIRVPQVRVVGPDGSQIGVIKTEEALRLAKNAGLDLVEVAPLARPPVCRILDFGKYMYEESKKNKSQKKTTTKLKEIKFRLNIDKHDYDTKVRHGLEFLEKGFKLKLTLSFRGREMEHRELGFDIVKKALEDLQVMGSVDAPAKLVGRNITVTVSPLPAAKRKHVKPSANTPQDEAP